MQITINLTKVALVEGDITEQQVDAIVNPANAELILGAGVAGAIRSKGGPAIQAACDQLGGCPVGSAVITTAGQLKARYVIHAVGPRMGEGEEDHKLQNATLSSLEVAEANSLHSLAFPAISTGIFGFPLDRCAEIMLSTTLTHVRNGTGLQQITFCLFDRNAWNIFSRKLANLTDSETSQSAKS